MWSRTRRSWRDRCRGPCTIRCSSSFPLRTTWCTRPSSTPAQRDTRCRTLRSALGHLASRRTRRRTRAGQKGSRARIGPRDTMILRRTRCHTHRNLRCLFAGTRSGRCTPPVLRCSSDRCPSLHRLHRVLQRPVSRTRRVKYSTRARPPSPSTMSSLETSGWAHHGVPRGSSVSRDANTRHATQVGESVLSLKCEYGKFRTRAVFAARAQDARRSRAIRRWMTPADQRALDGRAARRPCVTTPCSPRALRTSR